jgi:hypothetical protein
VALWRNLTAGGAARIEPERWLRAGLRRLRTHRQDDGRWRRFPFHYTMLALLDIDLAAATAELRHAAPVCERLVRRAPSDPVGRCRQRIAEAVLERI